MSVSGSHLRVVEGAAPAPADSPRQRGGSYPASAAERQRFAQAMAAWCRGYGLNELARSYELEAEIVSPPEVKQENLRRCKNR